MARHLAEAWYDAFMQTLQGHDAARPLKEAVATGSLGNWTQALTGVVVDVCTQVGWETAAKWHRAGVLPEARNEYLSLDALAFDAQQKAAWPFPVAVFELENSRRDDRVAYSLWKVLCVRARLRVVFCYRDDIGAGSALVQHLDTAVIGSLPIEERVKLVGETLLIIGRRAEESNFPYEFFKDWTLDKNRGCFSRI